MSQPQRGPTRSHGPHRPSDRPSGRWANVRRGPRKGGTSHGGRPPKLEHGEDHLFSLEAGKLDWLDMVQLVEASQLLVAHCEEWLDFKVMATPKNPEVNCQSNIEIISCTQPNRYITGARILTTWPIDCVQPAMI